ncbi:MAG TPA: hypothetical protein VGM88_03830 [Kofleriaceae bacterium]|jgi:hypothetical protein
MEHSGQRLLLGLVCVLAACSDTPPGRTYYQRNIEPILLQKCGGNTSGCHATNPDDPFQFAAGNFSVESFDTVQKRRDLLAPFGAYPMPLLLIKAVSSNGVQLAYNNAFQDMQVTHSGGAILSVDSDAFLTLQQWLANGATEDGLPPATPPQKGTGDCQHAIPTGFDSTMFVNSMTMDSFNQFKTTVQPVLTAHGCNAASCHGAPQSDFYITCGMTDDELAFNFSQAWSFVNVPVDDSQILKIPLAVQAGGRGHTGGDQFPTTSDPDYVAIKSWAAVAGKLDFAAGDPAKQFFADYVQPVLLDRGCSFEACHSPMATNDFKLRSGTQGFFSAIALEKNYDLLRNNFMALEFPDARRGRAIAKTLLPADPDVTSVAGITHRGGPVIETQGEHATPDLCPTFDPAGTNSAFCTVQEWLNRERAALGDQVTSMNVGDPINIVYVERAAGATAGRLDFDTFQGGAELRVAHATFAAGQVVNPVDAVADSTVISGGCGLPAGADIQSPDVANDGTRVVFAARGTATDPLEVYLVNIDGTGCVQVTQTAAAQNGLQIHNFDPKFSPDGSSIVFASTRGKSGPTKSRRRFLPQSDLWRVKVNGMTADQTSYEQMTVLSNSEVSPQFMREGRVTMTTEKASDGFYQLSGRRLNWDLTDYHPLLAQRSQSLYSDLTDLTQTAPSIGYQSATDIREGSDGNFLLILSDLNADGSPLYGAAGALAIFNRSIGPFEADRQDPGFVKSVTFLDQANATGRAGAMIGYRAPVSMPDGTIMVSYTTNAPAGTFDIVSISPRDSTRRNLFTNGGGKTRVDAVLAYKWPARELYDNRRQLVFGGGTDGDNAHAILHIPDVPMTFTVLTGNLRKGRPVDAFRKGTYLAVYSEGMCPATGCAANTNGIYQSRTMLGKAKLADDGSVRVQLPAQTGIVLSLEDGDGNVISQMQEEHQLGPGESISMGVSESLFDAVCGGCHGSVTGHELDIAVTPDALTGASQSSSATMTPVSIGN